MGSGLRQTPVHRPPFTPSTFNPSTFTTSTTNHYVCTMYVPLRSAAAGLTPFTRQSSLGEHPTARPDHKTESCISRKNTTTRNDVQRRATDNVSVMTINDCLPYSVPQPTYMDIRAGYRCLRSTSPCSLHDIYKTNGCLDGLLHSF